MISVTAAPLALMAANAAWPGVSKKVNFAPEAISTTNAPMCCGMEIINKKNEKNKSVNGFDDLTDLEWWWNMGWNGGGMGG